ncbi:MBL fold metallo-hydrolase [Piscinibacter sakaiensis]|uniref:MBL fold metallo-hydrolase n=1 Tax=Piscinibacter sakaiensis TaxID=1547922 RepID=UPI0006B5D4FE|nr:MBL fold metallo-hydrolase [Piscinibacter sakaiensis]
MRFCSLGSGSSGNATVVEAGDGHLRQRVLVDCGFSQRELLRRLARAGLAPADLDAIFVTHEHGDHVGCAFGFARRHRLPLWTSRGTWRACLRLAAGSGDEAASGLSAVPDPGTHPAADADAGPAGDPSGEAPAPLDGLLRLVRDGETVTLGALRLQPYTVPHDAREPLQPVFDDGASRLGVLTDAGCATPHLLERLAGCRALVLECNHDPALLAGCAYPASVKARIGGRLGHLANPAAAAILAACRHPGLSTVVAAHLSERNNTPALARSALAEVLGAAAAEIDVADPLAGLDWRTVG